MELGGEPRMITSPSPFKQLSSPTIVLFFYLESLWIGGPWNDLSETERSLVLMPYLLASFMPQSSEQYLEPSLACWTQPGPKHCRGPSSSTSPTSSFSCWLLHLDDPDLCCSFCQTHAYYSTTSVSCLC